MSAQFYVKRAQADLAPLRDRMVSLGISFVSEAEVDIVQVASVACDCEVIFASRLSEAGVFSILESEYGVDVSTAPPPTKSSLAGALCVATNGLFRWIFVRAEDSAERQRFTIAHELGHLFLEAIPELHAASANFEADQDLQFRPTELRVFSRCVSTEIAEEAESYVGRRAFSPADLRELHAHHFAAELLMPYDGVRRLVSEIGGSHGIRTFADRDRLVHLVARRYSVSLEAARRRIDKDLGLVPIDDHPNRDLFA